MAARRNAPRSIEKEHHPWDTLIFQGGGALGAYEGGAYEGLAGAGFDFDVVAGVSIGAVNAAIVASRGKDAVIHLARFWDAASDRYADLPMGDESLRRWVASSKAAIFGNPGMFVPRWIEEPWAMGTDLRWTHLYDPGPLRNLISAHVDFPRLSSSPRRLLMTAVDVQTGELALFDSRSEEMTPSHVLASGSLPPAFPPVRIGERYYWDGGLVTNTPLKTVLGVLPPKDQRRAVLIELFPREHKLPQSFPEVLNTVKDLTYMTKVDVDRKDCERDNAACDAVNQFLRSLEPTLATRLASTTAYGTLCERHHNHVDVYRLTHSMDLGEQESKDYDFSPTSIRRHWVEGRKAAKEAIAQWEGRVDWSPFRCHGRALVDLLA